MVAPFRANFFSFRLWICPESHKVQAILSNWKRRKGELSATRRLLKSRLDDATETLARFIVLKAALDENIGKIRKRDSSRIVAMHAPNFTDGIERSVGDVKEALRRIETVDRPSFTHSGLDEIGQCQQTCILTLESLNDELRQLEADVAVLERNKGFGYRVSELLKSIRKKAEHSH